MANLTTIPVRGITLNPKGGGAAALKSEDFGFLGLGSIYGDTPAECAKNFGAIHKGGVVALTFVPFVGPFLAAGAAFATPWIVGGTCGTSTSGAKVSELFAVGDAASDFYVGGA